MTGGFTFRGAPLPAGVSDGRVRLPDDVVAGHQLRFMCQGEPGTFSLPFSDEAGAALRTVSLTGAQWAVVLEGLAAHEDHYSQGSDGVQPSSVAVLIERQLRGVG